jgi:hypothetical protein
MLPALLTTLKMSRKPRYTIEETAYILGVTPHQVRTQIIKKRLPAQRGLERRYTGVMHDDLNAFIIKNNS